MPIIIHLDDIMSQRKVSLSELSNMVGITLSNLSIIKNGNVEQFVFIRCQQYVKLWIVSPEIFLNIQISLC